MKNPWVSMKNSQNSNSKGSVSHDD